MINVSFLIYMFLSDSFRSVARYKGFQAMGLPKGVGFRQIGHHDIILAGEKWHTYNL